MNFVCMHGMWHSVTQTVFQGEGLLSFLKTQGFKGAICKNVAKNGYYTQIHYTAASPPL